MKPYVPDIIGYKPFYIQTSNDSAAIDTAAEWGLIAKSNPVPILPSPKDPYKNDFKDENGDDEYCDRMYYESFSTTVGFYIKAFSDTAKGISAAEVLNSLVREFFNKISCGEFRIYDSYTGIGYRKVRYNGCSTDSIDFLARNDWARMIFEVSFKVNDPVTRLYLSNGSLTFDPLVKLSPAGDDGTFTLTSYDMNLNISEIGIGAENGKVELELNDDYDMLKVTDGSIDGETGNTALFITEV